jgi:hypothetical protein
MHAKHRHPAGFRLAGLRPLVRSVASCDAVLRRDRVEAVAGAALSARETPASCRFSLGGPPPAGAKRRILRRSLTTRSCGYALWVSGEGLPMRWCPACDGKRSQDGEARPSWSERRPGWPQQASGRRRVGNPGFTRNTGIVPVFAWQPPVAGAARGIVPRSLATRSCESAGARIFLTSSGIAWATPVTAAGSRPARAGRSW